MAPPPDYYAILEVTETATTQQIREAYKRAALKTHPDRVAADSPERAQRTRRFQLVNDAYYTLSDAGRRRAYDAQRRSFRFPSAGTGSGDEGTETEYKDPFEAAEAAEAEAAAAGGAGPSVGGAAYSWAWNFFSGMNGNKGAPSAAAEEARQRAEDAQFADVFEEMLREEGMAEPGGPNGTARPTSKFWSVVGGISGGALGFIVANVPGLVAGAVAGNRLGAIRDAKGKSVYAVFQELPQDDRARLLSQLAARVLSHAVGI